MLIAAWVSFPIVGIQSPTVYLQLKRTQTFLNNAPVVEDIYHSIKALTMTARLGLYRWVEITFFTFLSLVSTNQARKSYLNNA